MIFVRLYTEQHIQSIKQDNKYYLLFYFKISIIKYNDIYCMNINIR